MTLSETLKQLKALGNAKVRAQNAKSGAGDNQLGVSVPALLARIESEMADARPEVQWTMKNTLATIGIHFPKHRKQAIAIGEKMGVYRDWPVSKGCTPPFAPIWINYMVSQKG